MVSEPVPNASSSPPPKGISVRDPVHGTIALEDWEAEILEHAALRRLRHIKQLGFADVSYPGATHSRFIHSVGAMFVATRMWDALQEQLALSPDVISQLRRSLRMAVLLHDLGHAPMSHVSEALMPPLADLQLPSWIDGYDSPRQAMHEDYSLKLVLDSPLTPVLQQCDVDTIAIAQLISGQRHPHSQHFLIDGQDYFPLMRQIVSSELDADRMDYLLRDALYTGVSYGHYDLDWLIRNLCPVHKDNQVFLGLNGRALFTFEDFLLSRYHMFWSVYYHHNSVCYQEMLLRYAESLEVPYQFPSDPEAYMLTDDIQLLHQLRQSNNEWAQRIVQRKAYRMLLSTLVPSNDELKELQALDEDSHKVTTMFPQQLELFDTMTPIPSNVDSLKMSALSVALCDALEESEIPFFRTESKWVLSRYFRQKKSDVPPIFVFDESLQRAIPIERYSSLFRRYADVSWLVRVYCEPTKTEEARSILKELGGNLS